MISESVLKQVAKAAGITESYKSAWGDDVEVRLDIIERILSGLGYNTKSEEALLESAKKLQALGGVLEDVIVAKENHPIHINLYIGASVRPADFTWEITTESGQKIKGEVKPHVLSDTREDDGKLTFALPYALEMGYHSFMLHRRRRTEPYTTTLIVAPQACYKQADLANGKKGWGTSIQLYCLKSEQNWGIGDFTDLKHLVEFIADNGGDFVGLNPIHSLYPAQPEAASPYSPSSRRWLNVIYTDVTALAEYHTCTEAKALVGSAEFRAKLAELRALNIIDYTGVTEAKLAAMQLVFADFAKLPADHPRVQAFDAFVAQGEESLQYQATFDALHAHLKSGDDNVWGWPVFPNQYRKFTNTAVAEFAKENAALIRFYMYLQWNAELQLAEVQQAASDKGMMLGLYRDLAVGVSEGGTDTWGNDGTLCPDLSIGAPPDILGPQGQNWGLVPLNPVSMRRASYKPFIDMLRANMRHCGALRIDHVLGLLRLWMIPKGESAENGAYVYYPVHDMLAILALESHRHQCAVIGEDLGTVPDEIVGLLADAGVHSYKVFFFETAEDGGFYSPAHYPAQSMATLCTHDMPTLKGYWHCEDLRMGEEIGLYRDKAQLAGLFESRAQDKQQIINSMDWHGVLPSHLTRDAMQLGMETALNHAMQQHLAAGASALLSLQLEDWLEMDKPVNIPGTVDEYPNWRRKLSATVEAMAQREDIRVLARSITAKRRQASEN
uniref:4-alpha-glucanotransferase n=1 Tax=Thaumasiovibrio occultus TaxID=1891184 RepID=UPI000B35114A|nr:4-alpha-glucanotransferase [Thaumasiovibrio occultus]